MAGEGSQPGGSRLGSVSPHDGRDACASVPDGVADHGGGAGGHCPSEGWPGPSDLWGAPRVLLDQNVAHIFKPSAFQKRKIKVPERSRAPRLDF